MDDERSKYFENATNNIYNLDRGSEARSENLSSWNLEYGNAPIDSLINVEHGPVPNFHRPAKETRPVASPPTLANLTEEFNDLSRKMTLLRETLKHSGTGSGKESGPILVNSSVQVLQVGNVSDVLAAKRFIHDCIVELTFVDHFLDGNAEMTAHYREKLKNAIASESAKAKTIVIQGASMAPNSLELTSRGKGIVSKKEMKVPTETIKTKVNEASSSENHNGVSYNANEASDHVNKKLERSKNKAKKKGSSVISDVLERKKSTEQPVATEKKASTSKKSARSSKKSPIHLTK